MLEESSFNCPVELSHSSIPSSLRVSDCSNFSLVSISIGRKKPDTFSLKLAKSSLCSSIISSRASSEVIPYIFNDSSHSNAIIFSYALFGIENFTSVVTSSTFISAPRPSINFLNSLVKFLLEATAFSNALRVSFSSHVTCKAPLISLFLNLLSIISFFVLVFVSATARNCSKLISELSKMYEVAGDKTPN